MRKASNVLTIRNRNGGAVLWIVIGVAAVIAGLIIWALNLRNPAPNVTAAAYSGGISAPSPFPSVVRANVGVSYRVQTRNETRPSGAGPAFPPLTTTPWVAAPGAVVTFTLATGNATFSDGSTRITATAGANGVATVTLAPAADGVDTLRFSFTIGGSTAVDNAPIAFEVNKP